MNSSSDIIVTSVYLACGFFFFKNHQKWFYPSTSEYLSHLIFKTHEKYINVMCPACYINGFLFLIFGASGAAIASNPYVMLIATILTLIGFYWMWKAWKRRSKGKLMKNVKTTIIFLLIFAAGFITASFLTNGYFKNAYENKVNQTLNQPNIPNE